MKLNSQGLSNVRKYGPPPYRVVLVHGGPGAPGTMGPLAQALSADISVLEPLQTEESLSGLHEELKAILDREAEPPVIMVGASWGAMFSFMFSAGHPGYVRKLILVGSAVFEERYASLIKPTRLARLNPAQRKRAEELIESLAEGQVAGQAQKMLELSTLYTQADAFDPITLETGLIHVNAEQHRRVWAEASQYRSSGQLMAMAGQIRCPVIAIHGDYDPHPVEGVEKPLRRELSDFEMIVLEKCGHIPWIERQARERFLEILRERFD